MYYTDANMDNNLFYNTKNIILNIISFARERFKDINLEEKKGSTDVGKIYLIHKYLICLL